MILNATGLSMRFGGLAALEGIDIQVEEGKIHAVIGPNGSGKTTLLNLLSGIYKPSSGEVFFNGEKATGLPPYRIAEGGMARIFQNIRLFGSLTVLENIMLGSGFRKRCGLADVIFRTRTYSSYEKEAREKALQWLEFVGLTSKRSAKASDLSYGQQRLVEIARALATEPKLLLLDEPAAGLKAKIAEEIARKIKEIQAKGISIILVEHNMKFVMGISDVVTVLDFGRKISEGAPEQVQADERVIEAYLGKGIREIARSQGTQSEGSMGGQKLAKACRHVVSLQLERVDGYYGSFHVLRGISMEVRRGEIVALIGSNGAGKTTTLELISGLIRPTSGRVVFESRDISRLSPEDVVSVGIAHVPQGRRIFPGLTVYENLRVAAASWRGKQLSIAHEIERVFQIFPALKERKNQLGWSMSGGEQQMLAIARGLIAQPKVLLLDEPSLGLAPVIQENLFETIREIRAQGTTILIVEQNAALALNIADRGYVLETGEVVLEGTAQELAQNEDVKRAYLGG